MLCDIFVLIMKTYGFEPIYVYKFPLHGLYSWSIIICSSFLKQEENQNYQDIMKCLYSHCPVDSTVQCTLINSGILLGAERYIDVTYRAHIVKYIWEVESSWKYTYGIYLDGLILINTRGDTETNYAVSFHP